MENDWLLFCNRVKIVEKNKTIKTQKILGSHTQKNRLQFNSFSSRM